MPEDFERTERTDMSREELLGKVTLEDLSEQALGTLTTSAALRGWKTPCPCPQRDGDCQEKPWQAERNVWSGAKGWLLKIKAVYPERTSWSAAADP